MTQMTQQALSIALMVTAFTLALLWGLGTLVTNPPACWEDEVIVMVVEDPYGDLLGSLGCVPADNLPVDGFRP
ncbi:hypothetical protein LCGC14_2079870 [marine sediment metagenome]|uniref:Uncharacterized protein n=1 Tax=marine sediment metagenome TaxID=412755 RepID=A0A0F9F398_9ZZZZ